MYHQFFSRKGEERPDGKSPVRFIADTDAGQSPVVSEQFVCVDKRSLTTQGSGFFIQAVQKEIRLVGTFETFDKIRPGSFKDIENTEKKDTDITQFISNVKKYTEITEITPEILNELIEKILIHQAEKIDDKKVQEIDIYYRGVGIISFPVSLEDMTMVIEKMLNKKISA